MTLIVSSARCVLTNDAPQTSPLASNPTSDTLWCCHLVGSPVKEKERKEKRRKKGDKRKREKVKQIICHVWSKGHEEENPAARRCVVLILRRTELRTQSTNLTSLTGCKGWGVGAMITLPLPIPHTHYLLSRGKREVIKSHWPSILSLGSPPPICPDGPHRCQSMMNCGTLVV